MFNLFAENYINMRNIIFIGLIYLSLQVYGLTHDHNFDKIINNAECKCVPYYLCSANTTTGRYGLIHIKERDDCPSYLDVCCNPSEMSVESIHPQPENKECGYRNPDGVGFRITAKDENEAQFGEFPWMVAVLAEEFNAVTGSILNVNKCGGSLIHPQAVLTAAHCVSTRDQKYKIRAGEWDRQTTKELIAHQDLNVKSITIHDKYSAAGLLNDIAILFLETPVNMTSSVNTLCLPSQDVMVSSGTRCYASGWGRNMFGNYAAILRKVHVPIVHTDTCQEQLGSTLLGKQFMLDKSFVCAGNKEGKDKLKGADGSPLACPIPGQKERYQHIGIVLSDLGFVEDKSPGVYLNVPMFRTWIDEALSAHHL